MVPEHGTQRALFEVLELVATIAQVLHEDLARLFEALHFKLDSPFFSVNGRHFSEDVLHLSKNEVRVIIHVAVVDPKQIEHLRYDLDDVDAFDCRLDVNRVKGMQATEQGGILRLGVVALFPDGGHVAVQFNLMFV